MARPNILTRRYFVHKSFQGKFIFLYSLAVCSVVAIATWSLYLQIEAAVEAHLYRTHIKITRVGDFLVDLMFTANFYTILAVVLVVLSVSLLVFKGINRTFNRIDDSIETMAGGDFSQPYKQGYGFTEVGSLHVLLEQARTINENRFSQLDAALTELELGLSGEGDSERLKKGKAQLDLILNEISL